MDALLKLGQVPSDLVWQPPATCQD